MSTIQVHEEHKSGHESKHSNQIILTLLKTESNFIDVSLTYVSRGENWDNKSGTTSTSLIIDFFDAEYKRKERPIVLLTCEWSR